MDRFSIVERGVFGCLTQWLVRSKHVENILFYHLLGGCLERMVFDNFKEKRKLPRFSLGEPATSGFETKLFPLRIDFIGAERGAQLGAEEV